MPDSDPVQDADHAVREMFSDLASLARRLSGGLPDPQDLTKRSDLRAAGMLVHAAGEEVVAAVATILKADADRQAKALDEAVAKTLAAARHYAESADRDARRAAEERRRAEEIDRRSDDARTFAERFDKQASEAERDAHQARQLAETAAGLVQREIAASKEARALAAQEAQTLEKMVGMLVRHHVEAVLKDHGLGGDR